MLRPLRTERSRIGLFILFYILLSLFTGLWYICAIALLLIYSGIILYELYAVSRWLTKGSRLEDYPAVKGLAESIVMNVHNQKQRSKKRNKRLKTILERFYSMAVGMPDAVVVLEDDFSIEWANSQALPLLGISHDRDLGQFIGNLIRPPKFNAYLQGDNFDKPLVMQSQVNEGMTLNVRIVKFKDGASLLLARDITPRIQAEEMRRGFVSNVSHEMRTPLTVISGYTETLLGDETLAPEYEQPLTAIAQQSDRLLNIISGLLELSKLQSGSVELPSEPVAMSTLIREAVNELMVSPKHMEHTINLDLDEDLCTSGSAVLLQSVASNLIGNAVNHTDDGTEINVSWHKTAGGECELLVVDNGQGIDDEHLDHLTERFYRIDNSSRVRQDDEDFGSGLGLAIVKHIVEVHGGKLSITSEIGKGTRFCCVFQRSATNL